MYILFLYAIVVFLCAFSKNADRWYKCCFYVLFFLTAFRHPSMGGTDNIVYLITFQRVPLLDNLASYHGDYNIGYILLNSICKTIFGKYIYFQIIYTVICFVFIYKIIDLLNLSGRDKCLFLFSYLCMDFMWYNWGTLRQNLANLIFYYCATYYYSYRESLKISSKIMVLSIGLLCPLLFHTSAFVNIIIFPILLCLKKEVNVHLRTIWVLGVSLCLYVTSSLFLGYILSFAGQLEEGYGNYAGGQVGSIFMYLFKLLMFVFYCQTYDILEWKHKKYVLDLFSVFILLSSIDSVIIGRLASYYSLGFYSAMALIYLFFEKEIKPIALICFFGALYFLFLRHILYTDNALLSNYCFMWDTPNAKMIKNLFWRGAY